MNFLFIIIKKINEILRITIRYILEIERKSFLILFNVLLYKYKRKT